MYEILSLLKRQFFKIILPSLLFFLENHANKSRFSQIPNQCYYAFYLAEYQFGCFAFSYSAHNTKENSAEIYQALGKKIQTSAVRFIKWQIK